MPSKRDYIRKHYGELSEEEIGRQLGISSKEVRRLAKKLGLTRRKKTGSGHLWILLGVFFCALAVRIIHLLELRGSVLFDNLYGDAQTHHLLALNLVEDGFWGKEIFFRAPLYYYFLGVLYRIFGQSFLIPRIAQSIIGAGSSVLVFLIGRRLFHRSVAFGASLAASFYWIFICFDAELLIPNLIVFLDLLLILLLITRQSSKGFLLSGVVLGLSALARPNILIFTPMVLLWIAVTLWDRGKKHIVTVGALFLAGTSMIILPVTIRNYVVGRDFVLIASQGGVNFFIGNNPEADGKSAMQPVAVSRSEIGAYQLRYRDVIWSRDNVWLASKLAAEKARGGGLKPSQISNYWLSRAFRFMSEDTVSFLNLFLRKIYFFCNDWEIPSNVDVYYVARYHSSILRVLSWLRFGMIFPLAVVGMVIGLDRWRRYLLLYLFVISYGLSVILFFINSRYRLPVIPFLLLFGFYALRWLVVQIRNKRIGDIWPYVLLLAVSAIIANSRLYDVRSMKSAIPIHNNIGDIYANEGDYDRAVIEYQISLAADSNYAETHNNLGVAYANMGENERALAEYEAALRLDPGYALVHTNRANLYAQMGDYRGAVEEYKKALNIDPGMVVARYRLGMLMWEQKEYDEAVVQFREVAKLSPENFLVRSSLGMAYAITGEYEKALEEGRQAVSLAPLNPGVYYNLGTILMRSGDLDAATTAYRRALELDPSLAGAHYKLGEIYEESGHYISAKAEYERAIDLNPRFAGAYVGLAKVLHVMDDSGKAIQMVEKGLALDPGDEDGRRLLEELKREK